MTASEMTVASNRAVGRSAGRDRATTSPKQDRGSASRARTPAGRPVASSASRTSAKALSAWR